MSKFSRRAAQYVERLNPKFVGFPKQNVVESWWLLNGQWLAYLIIRNN